MSGLTGNVGNFIAKLDSMQYAGLEASPLVKVILKSGCNADVGATDETLWSEGGDISYLTSAETMLVASTDADDTSAGTGARTMLIEGLDDNYLEVSETVTLNGTSDVTTVNAYLRINETVVLTAGSSGENEGTIDITASSAGTVQAAIPAGANHDLMAIFTVPAGHTYLLTDIHIGMPRTDDGTIKLKVRPLNGVFQIQYMTHVNEATVIGTSTPFHTAVEKSDIKLTGIRVGGNNVDITASFTGCLIDNSIIPS